MAEPRMTLSRVVELLLERRAVERSSVTLSRNAKGETQIEVVVRTGDDESLVATTEDAEAVAQRVYDRLRARYPLASGHTTAPDAEATAPARKPLDKAKGASDGK
jgi:hypothetical protein